MNLVDLTCPGCGAVVRKDPYSNTYICDFCGKKLTPAFNAGVVGSEINSSIERINTLIRFGEVEKTFVSFAELQSQFPNSPIVWVEYIRFLEI